MSWNLIKVLYPILKKNNRAVRLGASSGRSILTIININTYGILKLIFFII